MINWSEVAPAIRTLISGLATTAPVTPSFEGRWADRKAEFIHTEVQRSLILRIARVREFQTTRVYRDIVVTPDVGDPYGALQEVIVGMREFVVEVRVEAFEHTEQADRWSWSMLERIRTGLQFQRAADALLAVNVGLVSLGDSRDVSFTFDKRRINAAMFEVTMNGAFCHADTVTTDWFEHVVLTSKIRNPADELLPSPPNVTDLAVPPLPPPPEPEPDPDPEP